MKYMMLRMQDHTVYLHHVVLKCTVGCFACMFASSYCLTMAVKDFAEYSFSQRKLQRSCARREEVYILRRRRRNAWKRLKSRGRDCSPFHIGGICLENELFLFWGRGVWRTFFPLSSWSDTEEQEQSEKRRNWRLDDQKKPVIHQNSYAENKLG